MDELWKICRVLKANEEKTEERERFLKTAITTGYVAKQLCEMIHFHEEGVATMNKKSFERREGLDWEFVDGVVEGGKELGIRGRSNKKVALYLF